MKKHFRSIASAIVTFTITINSYSQVLTVPNGTIGNSGNNKVQIYNNDAVLDLKFWGSYPNMGSTAINFKDPNDNTVFSIGQYRGAACGTGIVHMQHSPTTKGIHLNGAGIRFSTQSFNICGNYGVANGVFQFDDQVAAPKLVIGSVVSGTTRFDMPIGFELGVQRKSYFGDLVTIGSTCSSLPDPTVKLAVKGKILCEAVQVKLENGNCWADFVFDKSYKLMPLAEVEQFINKNKHLPDVPSAEEMVDNGLDVATMDAKLLQKIEELTLYMIEIKKEVEVLKNENKLLKSNK